MEVTCLKMNMEKIKVILFSHPAAVMLDEKGEWPHGVCKTQVINYFSFCACCQMWVRWQCHGVPGRLHQSDGMSW